jgi:hypothetical protein
MAGSGEIGLFGFLFKTLSIDTLSQFDERMFWIDEISQQMMMVEEGYLPPLGFLNHATSKTAGF